MLTKAANSTSGIYNDKWLRIRVTLDAGYTCATDCTWTLAYDFGGATSATNHATWTVTVHP